MALQTTTTIALNEATDNNNEEDVLLQTGDIRKKIVGYFLVWDKCLDEVDVVCTDMVGKRSHAIEAFRARGNTGPRRRALGQTATVDDPRDKYTRH